MRDKAECIHLNDQIGLSSKDAHEPGVSDSVSFAFVPSDYKTQEELFASQVRDMSVLKADMRALEVKVNKNITNGQIQLEEQGKQFRGEQEKRESEFNELIRKITIGNLSKGFDDKAAVSHQAGVKFLWSFYSVLGVILIVGIVVICKFSPVIFNDTTVLQALKIFGLKFIGLAPVYLPLVWAAFHFNRWAAQKNRLVEEYEHKKVVVETYLGLANQVDELKEKGVASAPDLLGNLLQEVVNVVCFDASSVLDKTKIMTPIGEVVKLIESLGKASAEIGKGKEA